MESALSAAQGGVDYLLSAASLDFGLDDIYPPSMEWSGERLALLILSCSVMAYLLYYLCWVVNKPKVVGTGELKERLLKNCPILSECYWPTLWGFYSHVSTISRFMLQKPPHIEYRRKVLTLSDGGEVALDWATADPAGVQGGVATPILLVLPGITGCSMDNYMQHIVEDGLLEGYRPVVFNQRGNGGMDLKTPRTYCAADISDLFEVVQCVQMSFPKAPIVGIGVSLGGMLLTQYLHQLGRECDLSAVISISSGWIPLLSRASLESGAINRLYCNTMVNNIKTMVKRSLSQKLMKEEDYLPFDLEEVMKAKFVSDIDTHLTAPLFGFSSLDDYYRACRNDDKLHKIRRPFVCITSADDPFVPSESLPYEEVERNPHTVLVVTSHGGHFGFIEGLYPNKKTWLDRAVRQVLTEFKNCI